MPTEILGVTDASAIATYLVGFAAAAVALWGIVSQRAIARRQMTMELISRTESDQDLIDARNASYLVGLSAHQPQKNSDLHPNLDGKPDDEPKKLQQSGRFLSETAERDEAQKDLHAVRVVFNTLELFAIGIQFNIIDFDLLKRFAKSSIIRDWDRGAPLIFELRKTYSQPTMYHELEELVRALRGNTVPPRRRFFWLQRFRLVRND